MTMILPSQWFLEYLAIFELIKEKAIINITLFYWQGWTDDLVYLLHLNLVLSYLSWCTPLGKCL